MPSVRVEPPSTGGGSVNEGTSGFLGVGGTSGISLMEMNGLVDLLAGLGADAFVDRGWRHGFAVAEEEHSRSSAPATRSPPPPRRYRG
jgi:hypothetical protein